MPPRTWPATLGNPTLMRSMLSQNRAAGGRSFGAGHFSSAARFISRSTAQPRSSALDRTLRFNAGSSHMRRIEIVYLKAASIRRNLAPGAVAASLGLLALLGLAGIAHAGLGDTL